MDRPQAKTQSHLINSASPAPNGSALADRGGVMGTAFQILELTIIVIPH
jgi:hypothetical protein